MPPYATSDLLSAADLNAADINKLRLSATSAGAATDIVTVNVGGQVFQATRQTLSLAGATSILSSLPSYSFFDRDPHLFSHLLSLLRSSRLLATAAADPRFLSDLAAEAQFYGIAHQFSALLDSKTQITNSTNPLSFTPSIHLRLPGRNPPSAIAAADSSVHAAVGGLITTFSAANLTGRSTILTPLPAIDHLLELSPSILAAGAADFPSLHVLDLRPRGGVVKTTLSWSPSPAAGSMAAVQAVAASDDFLFTSFESCRRNASAILAFDIADSSLRPSFEIARREVYGAELDSAIPATKLKWIPSMKLLMAAGSHSSPSGLLGNIRLWDIRSGKPAWEFTEKVDCFADITVSDELSSLFKVGTNSGEVFMADLRRLSSEENPWICLGDKRKISNSRREGKGCKIESCGEHVLCSKGGEVEVWSEVKMSGEKMMRKNLMGRAKDSGKNKITQIAVGGSRMVVTREDEQFVEVWESTIKG